MAYEYQVDVAGIMYGMDSIRSAELTQPLFDTLSVGNACCAEFTMSFWPTEPPPRMAKIIPYVREKGTTAWKQLGVFWIDTRQKVGTLLDIVCYDVMLRADMMWDPGQSAKFPMTMRDAVNNIASIMEVQLDSRTTVSNTYTIPEKPEEMTMRNVLEYVAAAHAGNWIVTAQGKLLLNPLFASMPDETHYLIEEHGNAITFGGTRILV